MRLCKKRIAAVLLAFLLFCSSCLQAFADETAEGQTTQEDTIVEEVPESEETPTPTDEEQRAEETEESQESEEIVEDSEETITILTFSLTSAKPEITEGQTEYTFEGIHVGMRRAEDETAGVSIFEFAEDGSSTSLEVEPGSYVLYTICGNSSYVMPEEETTVELQPGAQEIIWELEPVVQEEEGRVDIADCSIEGIEDAAYTGEEVHLALQVLDEEQILEEGTDYQVSYENNIEIGTASVCIEGIGAHYFGSVTREFRIGYDISLAEIGPIEALKYNGKERTPAITVTYEGQELVEGTDYELTYENNINAGKKAVAKITGIGSYIGTLSKNFKIKRIYNKITLKSVTKKYSVYKQKFYLKPVLIDKSAKLTYKSNNKKVKVNSKGKVTIAKEFIGTAKITVSCAETKNAAAKSKTIKITVKAPVLAGHKMIQRYMTKNPEYRKKKPLEVKGLMLHSVNCPVPSAMSFINRWDSSSYTRASIHGFIDANTGKVYQTLPWTIQAGHCYKGPKGSGNKTHIGVEMCEASSVYWLDWNKISCSNWSYARSCARRTYRSAVDLFAMLCVQFGLNPMEKGVIISHAEGWELGIASDHGDPENLWKCLGLSYTMDGFRKDVKKAMKKYR